MSKVSNENEKIIEELDRSWTFKEKVEYFFWSLKTDGPWRMFSGWFRHSCWKPFHNFVYSKVLGGCRDDCSLCAVDNVLDWHYNKCEQCKSDTECPVYNTLIDVHEKIVYEWMNEHDKEFLRR